MGRLEGAGMITHKLNYNWDDLTRPEKTNIIKSALMRHIFINGNGCKIGLPEINVNIGKGKNNLRIDVLEINRKKNYLVGYEIKSCIEDFRADKKWRNYLQLVDRLNFVFDTDTYSKHIKEIEEKISDSAGIYTYSINARWISFQKGGKQNTIPPKDEIFYRVILFNYLNRIALKHFNAGGQVWEQ